MTSPVERVQRLREAADYIDKDGPWTSRWDRAADETHDLLAGVIERHRQENFQRGSLTWKACWTCGEEDQWPCPDLADALAVLDALDPLSDPSEEGK